MDKFAFIEKASRIHNNKYDYSKVDYKNNKTKVCIICPEHGEFWQRPDNHMGQKQGCPKCGRKIVADKLSKKQNDFIRESSLIHNNKYDYSKVNYKQAHEKVCIICPEHGSFFTTPHNHLKGYNCPVCSKEKSSQERIVSQEEFIAKAEKLHGDTYDYSKVRYEGSFKYITITCPKHGDFKTLAYVHLQGSGCPACRNSKPQNEIADFIETLGFEIKKNVRTIIPPLEIDIYIPEKKIGIEFNGLYWHSESKLCNSKYHLNKTLRCEQEGIQLIQIFENEWISKKEIIKSILRSKLGKIENKVFARKTEVRYINDDKNFLEENHIQGKVSGEKIKIGLFYDKQMLGILTFGKPRFNKNYDLEILRFCYKKDIVVVGGFSKMLAFFRKDFPDSSLITYSDRRYSNGNVYRNNGFKKINETTPNYFYLKNGKLFSRIGFQKHKLKNKLKNYDNQLTERENMKNNGFDKIYDCGSLVFEKGVH